MPITKLKYHKLVFRELQSYGKKATDVLYRKMHTYDNEAKHILSTLINLIKDQPQQNLAQIKSLYSLMAKADETVIDCAHKLAPYQTPKLESIEVKGKVDHRYVMRAPQRINSVEEWMQKTGAERMKIEQLTKKEEIKRELPISLHDFEEDSEYNEPGVLN